MIFNRLINRLKKIKEKSRLFKNKVFTESSFNVQSTSFEGHNYLGNNVTIINSEVGLGTYIGDNSIFNKTLIGKFCSIAKNVEIVSSNHPIDFVSTHPAFHRGEHELMKKLDLNFCDANLPEFKNVPNTNYACIIGNDVWIGNGVLIMNGVEIGNGAVVGAGALITKNIEPYAIVGGIPAKFIKYRFTLDIRKKIEKSCWWNKDLLKLKEIANSFSNPKGFK